MIRKEFGNLADERASDPVLISKALNIKRSVRMGGTESVYGAKNGQMVANKIDDRYFSKHFAHTPTA